MENVSRGLANSFWTASLFVIEYVDIVDTCTWIIRETSSLFIINQFTIPLIAFEPLQCGYSTRKDVSWYRTDFSAFIMDAIEDNCINITNPTRFNTQSVYLTFEPDHHNTYGNITDTRFPAPTFRVTSSLGLFQGWFGVPFYI